MVLVPNPDDKELFLSILRKNWRNLSQNCKDLRKLWRAAKGTDRLVHAMHYTLQLLNIFRVFADFLQA
jgi:hypothetical protein